MKFAVISRRGEGLAIAMRLREEGHAVVFVVVDRSEIGKGFVDQTVPMEKESVFGCIRRVTDKSAVLIFTSSSLGAIAERCKQQGYLALGSGNFHAHLERDGTYQNIVLQSAGLSVIPKDPMVPYALEGWFNGDDFIYPIFGMVPEYGFLAGDLGPVTECAGVTGFAFKAFRPLRFKETLEKLRPTLKTIDYKGPISIDVLGGAVLRIVCGFRFDFTYLLLGFLDGELSQLIVDTVRGLAKQMRVVYDYGMCVRATMPPYPHVVATPKNLAIYKENEFKGHMVPIGVQRKDGSWFTASFTGESYCVCDFAQSIKEAQQLVYQTFTHVMVPDLQFRIDIGGLALKNISYLLQSDPIKKEEHLSSAERTEVAAPTGG